MFFATLIVVSLFTVRLSDAILDSKIGALDRTLGFVFGVARGFLLAVVAFAIFNWLVSEKQQPEWVKNAKTRPVLTETANKIVALLPEDAAATIDGWIKSQGDVTPTRGAGRRRRARPAGRSAPAPPPPADPKKADPSAPASRLSTSRSSTRSSSGRAAPPAGAPERQ